MSGYKVQGSIPYIFLDFATFLKKSPPSDVIYKLTLEQQFSKLNISDKSHGDVSDYFRTLLLGEKAVTMNVSWPAFEREEKEDKYNNKFYNNIAIRISVTKNEDLVLMGDLVSNERRGAIGRTYRVKGFTVMDPGLVHNGELSLKCIPILKLDSEKNWDWESEDRPSFQPGVDDWNKSLFSDNFMDELGNRFVADYAEVTNTIDNWSRYIAAIEHIIEKNRENGYTILKPEFEILYTSSYNRRERPPDVSHVKYIKRSNGRHWSKEKYLTANGEAEQKVITHIIHECLEKTFLGTDSGKKYRDAFNSLTRRTVAIINPDKINSKKKNEWDRPEQIINLDATRISVAYEERVEPEEMLKGLEKERSRLLSEAERKSAEDKKKNAATIMRLYQEKTLPKKLSDYLETQMPFIENRVKSEFEKLVTIAMQKAEKALKDAEKAYNETLQKATVEYEKKIAKDKKDKGNLPKDNRAVIDASAKLNKAKEEADVETIRKKIDFEAMLSSEVSKTEASHKGMLISEKEEETEAQLNPEYQKSLAETKKIIEAKYEEDRAELIKNETKIRLHACFTVSSEEVSPKDIVSKMESKVAAHNNFRILYDDIGDVVLINRQKKALSNFENGYVMNPFLATSLFSPGSKSKSKPVEIEKFYMDKLNSIQKQAVRSALTSDGIFLIQGPPGTGKTQVIAEITTQLVLRGKKVLISSENHKAVDNAFAKLPKDPAIRPLRLISKRINDNEHSVEKLLDNFYGNISSTLNERVAMYKNYDEYLQSFNERISNLEMKNSEVKRLEKQIKSVHKEIAKKEESIEKIRANLDRIYSDNNEIQSKIDEYEYALNKIRSFEIDYVDSEDQDILKGLEEYQKNLSSVFSKYNLSPDNTAKAATFLYNSSMPEIVGNIELMETHRDYLEKHMSKEKMGARELTDANKTLREYENKNGIGLQNFPIFNHFGITRTDIEFVSKIRNEIFTVRDDKEKSVNKRIESLKKALKDPIEMNFEIKGLEMSIDELKDGSEYSEYDGINQSLITDVRKMFRELQIETPFTNVDAAIKIIRAAWDNKSREYKNNKTLNKNTIPIYQDIIKYLGDKDVLERDRDEYTSKLFDFVNVVGMTCTSNNYMRDDNFDLKLDVPSMGIDVVIVDEVSKIPFLEILQPILSGKSVILVGDHRQLPPMYTSRVSKGDSYDNYDHSIFNEEMDMEFKDLYQESFFKELFIKTPATSKVMMNEQYRMHPQIMDVVNEFYSENKLIFGGRVEDKEHYLTVAGANRQNIIHPKNHLIFIDCKGDEVQESGSTSFTNPREAEVVKKLLESIDRSCKTDRFGEPLDRKKITRFEDPRLSVGVICPYSDQARLIRRKGVKYDSFNNLGDEKFKVSAIDDFQGDERDIIILSMTRTRKSRFLEEYRRINVALSRARRLLIIVGNADTLKRVNVGIDDSKGRITSKRVYENIIKTADKYNGFRRDDAILGGDLS